MTTTPSLPERLLDAAIGSLELYGVYLGTRLGLYGALRDRGALNAPELAVAAGIHRRYAREWLEQQAVAGFLVVVEDDVDPERRRFALPAEHVAALCDEEHGDHLAPLARLVVGVAGALPEVVEAYRTGAGVPFAHYGVDVCAGQGGINRPAFTRDLVETWLPAVPDLHRRLERGGRVVDVGCGVGWAAIAIARAYPTAQVFGVDADLHSIETARGNARRAGVDVRFECRDVATLDGRFDLALVLEVLHDLARPVEALAAIRASLADGGSVLIADERVAERFAAPGDPIERMMYGWSVSHCLPTVMGDPASAAIGTAIRPATVRDVATRAGFGTVEILPIENLLFRFYRLTV